MGELRVFGIASSPQGAGVYMLSSRIDFLSWNLIECISKRKMFSPFLTISATVWVS